MITTLPSQERVDEVAKELAPEVVRIRLRISYDWSNDPAMYFRVLLSDDASRLDRLREVTGRVRATLFNELELDSFEHIPYYLFRSQSEQAALQEASWE